jgi:hypothetical protein
MYVLHFPNPDTLFAHTRLTLFFFTINKDGKYKDVSCFTMVDDNSIGPDMCMDPPEGTPRVVKAEDAREWAAKIAAARK